MEKEQLQYIMMELSFIHSYIKILRDYCEFNEGDCRHAGLILPFLNYICEEYNKTYNKLDNFERKLNGINSFN